MSLPPGLPSLGAAVSSWQGALIAAIGVSAVITIFLLREDGPGPK